MRPATIQPRAVLIIACIGMVLSSLDVFIANVALPKIAVDLGSGSLGELSWVLNAYAIVFSALLVPAGRFADRVGRSTGFLIGVAVFVVGSAACAVAPNVPVLIACRIVQAVGAALVVPTSLALILAAYPPERRGGAVRTWSVVGAAAVAVAPVVAGPLVDISWRWVFLINVPIGIVALIAGRQLLPRGGAVRGPAADILGAGLLTAGITTLTLALVEADSWGWSSSRVIGLIAVSAALTAAFLRRSSKHPSPVLETALLRDRSFALASLAMLLSNAALGGLVLSVVLWIQQVWGWSPLLAGLCVAPGPLLTPVCSTLLTGRVSARFGPGFTAAVGAAIFAGGLAWWAVAASTQPNYAVGGLGAMLLTGVGLGLSIPTLYASAATVLPPARFATGAGVVTVLRQIGLTLGVAVLIALLGAPHGAAGELAAFRRGWYVFAAVSLAAALAGMALPRPRPVAAAAPASTPVSAAAEQPQQVAVDAR